MSKEYPIPHEEDINPGPLWVWIVFYGIVFLLLACTPSPAATPRVSIRATQVVMSGGTILVVCKVPRNANNRTLRFGVEAYSVSTKQLDGDQARVTWQMFVEHMPCDVGPAFCEVVTAGGRVDRVELPVTVAACGMKRTN